MPLRSLRFLYPFSQKKKKMVDNIERCVGMSYELIFIKIQSKFYIAKIKEIPVDRFRYHEEKNSQTYRKTDMFFFRVLYGGIKFV